LGAEVEEVSHLEAGLHVVVLNLESLRLEGVAKVAEMADVAEVAITGCCYRVARGLGLVVSKVSQPHCQEDSSLKVLAEGVVAKVVVRGDRVMVASTVGSPSCRAAVAVWALDSSQTQPVIDQSKLLEQEH
jgi:hypothetical protein